MSVKSVVRTWGKPVAAATLVVSVAAVWRARNALKAARAQTPSARARTGRRGGDLDVVFLKDFQGLLKVSLHF